MSELSNRIKALRGTRSAEEIAASVGLSRESFYRIERGGSVKLKTLRQMAQRLHVSEPEWLELLAAWLRNEAGPDAMKLWIDPKAGSPLLREQEADQTARAMMLFKNLNPRDRSEITKTMQRKAVLNCLPSINAVWERFDELNKKK